MDMPGGEDSSQRTGDGESAVMVSCHMCHDAFEHFYNEDTEELHLESAIMVDDLFYHPLCYEDYKVEEGMSFFYGNNNRFSLSTDIADPR
jgi:hypothetical protein